MANLKVSLENIIPLTEARDHFSQIVADVQKDKLYILTKGGKPAVAVIDVKYLEGITGGSVNTISIEAEIQKDPAKVGRVPMIKNNGNTGFIPKPTFNAPAMPKPVTQDNPPTKVSFEPSTPKPFTPTPPTNNNDNNSNQPKPTPSPYTPYKPAMPGSTPNSTPNPTPSSIPASTPAPSFTPTPKPFTPANTAVNPLSMPTKPFTLPTPNPTSSFVLNSAPAASTNPTPTPASTPVPAPKPYVSPYQTNNNSTLNSSSTTPTPTPPVSTFKPEPITPVTTPATTSNTAPTTPLATPNSDDIDSIKPISTPSSDSISISTPTPLSLVPPKPVETPITMRTSPTNAPSNVDFPSAPATTTPKPNTPASPFASGSGLTMQSTMPNNNTGSVIDVIPTPEDMTSPKPIGTPVSSASPVVTGQSGNTSDEPDDMVLD